MKNKLPTILKAIIDNKHNEVALAKASTSMKDIHETLKSASPVRPFMRAIKSKIDQGESAVIAEIKKGSPSKGILRDDFDPKAIAHSYETYGASCISILTDQKYFYGSDEHLVMVKSSCDLPVLRKDFIVDEYQIYQSRALGADCILLICAALDSNQITHFYNLALDLGMDVLVEVHDATELEVALSLNKAGLGINNRNLHTFEESLDTTFNLIEMIPKSKTVITESAIRSKSDVLQMRERNVNAFLVGEAFMRATNPGEALRKLFSKKKGP